jgi:hypothetical protein
MKRFLFLLGLMVSLFTQAQTGYTYTADLPFNTVDWDVTQPFIPGIKAMRDGVLTDPAPPFGFGNWLPFKSDLNRDEKPILTLKVPAVWDAKLKALHIYWNSGNGIQVAHPTTIEKLYRSDHLWHLSGSYIHRDPSGWIDVPLADSNEVIDGIRIKGGVSTFGTYPQDEGFGDIWGKQFRFEGYYKNVTRPRATKPKAQFKYTFGMDTYWWDWMKNDSNGFDASQEVWEKCQLYSDMGVKTARFYMWDGLGYLREGVNEFSFQATINGWYNDSVLTIAKRRGIEPIMTIMGGPKANYTTWPDGENAKGRLVPYSLRDQRENPQSYANLARMAYVVSGRYGNNGLVPDILMGTYYDHSDPFVPDDHIRKGLNLIHWIEFVNEPDNTFWDDPTYKYYEYFSGRKMAAYCSAIKDGNKGTVDGGYGAGVGVGLVGGVKLVLSGLARPSPDQMQGFRDWCIEHRGWIDSAAGIWDCPVDALNYHDYSKDEKEQTGSITTAMPPEMSGVLTNAQEFQDMSQLYFNGIPWWVTEFGFDTHDSSRFQAPAFSGHSKWEACGLWYLRTQLTYLTVGVDRMTAYQAFATDSMNATQFASMMLVRYDLSHLPADLIYTKYPAANFMCQAKRWGNYVFDSLLSSGSAPGSVWCMRMKVTGTDSTVYAIWSVEDTSATVRNKFGPSGVIPVNTWNFIEQTGTYDLHIPDGTTITEVQLNPWIETPSLSTHTVSGGVYHVGYSSKPVFIETFEDTGGGGGGGGGGTGTTTGNRRYGGKPVFN